MNQILPFFKAVLLSLVLVLFVTPALRAQTKGMIVKPATGAGRAVLDPNGDGYVSGPATPLGFKFNDVQESEIPYRALPLPSGEVIGDLLRGPSDGFSDFSYLFGNVDPVYTYLSGGNLMFRFRLGGIAPNSKGYSILIDTDNKFGNTGPDADPNYTIANPGFEVEIVLATGFGVRLYNVDGVSSPAANSQLVNLSYEQYAQKAIAYTTNGGSPDYFYDFYIPFTEITSRIPSFTASTPVRMVANTVMSAQHSALAGPISDVGGIDDKVYAGNYAAAFTNIIKSIIPTSLNVTPTSDFPALRSVTPIISGTYSAGTSTTANPIRISGTSTEAAGTVITVYLNGAVLGTTTVGSGGNWSYTLPANTSLAASDKLTATATASGKSVSNLSNEVIVIAPAFVCTPSATPTILCASDKGFTGTVPAGVAAGSIIRIYKFGEPDRPVLGIPDIPVRANGTWGWTCRDGINATDCSPGQGCVSGTVTLGNGSYYAVLEEGNGKCASARSNEVCVGKGNLGTTATPTITTSPILQSTTAIAGTAVANATVIVLINGKLFGNTTATSTGAWTMSGMVLKAGQVVSARALSPNICVSNEASVTVMAEASIAPVVNGPIRAGATTISGTSTEPAGTVITVYRNGQAICSTNCPVVDAYGNWTLSGLATTALTSGNTITATATAPGKGASALSNSVSVQAATTAPAIPVITGSYVEGATAVSGTGPASTNINLYIDGYFLGSVISSGTGSWTVNGLGGSNIEKLLYAGGSLTATSGTVGTNESGVSNIVKVQCSTAIPDRTKAVTAIASAICQNSSAMIRISNSEIGISYTLRNDANTADLSSSVLGNGGDIVLTSHPLSSSQRIRVAAVRGESPGCGAAELNSTVNITVNPNPAAFMVTAQNTQVCIGTKAILTVSSSQTNVNYQIRLKADNSAVGAPVAGTGGQITLETPVLNATGSFNFYVQATSGIAPTYCGTQMSNEVTITVNAMPSKTLEFIEGAFNADGTMNLIIRNSEVNVLYQLRMNGTDFRAPVAGNGGDVVLVSDVVNTEKKTYTAAARNISSGCFVELEQKIELQGITPLPVELVSFKAVAQQNQVLLQWATASERDNDRFEVERSQDGRKFTLIGQVKGKGTSSLTNSYTFTDKNPGTGVNYYRLRQVDFDGAFEYSKTIAVHMKETRASVKAYPNPFSYSLQVGIASEIAGTIQVTVADAQGRVAIEQTIVSEGRYSTLELSTQQLATGVYFLRVTGGGVNSTTKLIKSH